MQLIEKIESKIIHIYNVFLNIYAKLCLMSSRI